MPGLRPGCRDVNDEAVVVKVRCPNCRRQVRLTLENILVEHETRFGAPCRLAGQARPVPFAVDGSVGPAPDTANMTSSAARNLT